MNEPRYIRAGDTVTWSETNSTYPASASWTLKYYLRGPSKLDVTCTGSGDTFTAAIAATASNALVPGFYVYSGRFEKGSEVYTPEGFSGSLEVLPNLTEAPAGYDGRSHVRTVFEAIQATIESRATKSQLMTTIAGRQIQYLSPDELLNLYFRYKRLLDIEVQEERLSKGLGGGKILIRFEGE